MKANHTRCHPVGCCPTPRTSTHSSPHLDTMRCARTPLPPLGLSYRRPVPCRASPSITHHTDMLARLSRSASPCAME